MEKQHSVPCEETTKYETSFGSCYRDAGDAIHQNMEQQQQQFILYPR